MVQTDDAAAEGNTSGLTPETSADTSGVAPETTTNTTAEVGETSVSLIGKLCNVLSKTPIDSEAAKSMYNSITSAIKQSLSPDDAKDITSKILAAVKTDPTATATTQSTETPVPSEQPIAEDVVAGDIKKDDINLSEQLLNNKYIKNIIEHLKLSNDNGDLAHNICEAIHTYNLKKDAHPATKQKLGKILSDAKFLPPQNESVLDEETTLFNENDLDITGKKVLGLLEKIGNKNKKKDDYDRILQQEINLTNHPDYKVI